MGITNHHYDQAAALLAQHHPDDTTSHSDAYWQGYLDVTAWCLAGRPDTYESHYRYAQGTVSRDAWSYGWISGQQFVEQFDQHSA